MLDKVNDHMTREVESCAVDDDLKVAARRLDRGDCGCLPVVDPQTERLVGVVTDRDICLCTAGFDLPPSELTVELAMSTGPLETCLPTDDVAEVTRRMGEAQVRRMPVVDVHGTLVGMFSQRDAIAAARAKEPCLSARQATQALDAIGSR